MARKREKAAEEQQADTSFNPAEFDPAMKQGGAATATQEAQAQEAAEVGRGFAERVGKREPGYTAAGKHDAVVGMRLREFQNPEKKIYLSAIKLDEKPSDAVRAALKEAGFSWNGQEKEWERPIRFDTRQQDRLHAERTFDEVNKMIRTERGIEHGAGISAA